MIHTSCRTDDAVLALYYKKSLCGLLFFALLAFFHGLAYDTQSLCPVEGGAGADFTPLCTSIRGGEAMLPKQSHGLSGIRPADSFLVFFYVIPST